ncbi:MAG: hypothetical protein M5R40_03685 [Anaerolineae bacterium]|nr:hypothetical protein [Anaerolineae bacterium]
MRDIAYGGIDCTGKPRVVVAGFGEERKQYTGPHPHKDPAATIDTYLPDAMILCYFNLEPKALEDFIQQVVRATDFSCLLIIETRGDNGKALRIPVTADAKSMRRRAREVLEHYAGTVQDKGKLLSTSSCSGATSLKAKTEGGHYSGDCLCFAIVGTWFLTRIAQERR